jgi:hypothetical protein
MKTRKLSVSQYAKEKGISRQAVLKRLHPNVLPLPNVIKAEKIGSTWILTIKPED